MLELLVNPIAISEKHAGRKCHDPVPTVANGDVQLRGPGASLNGLNYTENLGGTPNEELKNEPDYSHNKLLLGALYDAFRVKGEC